MTEVHVPIQALAILAAKAAKRAQKITAEIGPNSFADHLSHQSTGYARAMADAINHEEPDVSAFMPNAK